VESAMVGAAKGREADAALARAVETIGESADIALELYQKGLVDFLNVLQSEQALYQVQDQFVQHRQDLAVTYVGLFKALGGGWEPDADAPGVSPAASGAASPTVEGG
jgi:multidrug efflux system outer membrane protein